MAETATDAVRRGRIDGRDPDGRPYGGELTVTPDGEAFRARWLRRGPDGTVALHGVAFVHEGVVVAARSRLAEPSAGVVAYAIREDGDMPARWYHPELAGRLGEGLSTDGPRDTLEGLYRAEYASASARFDPLVKELVRVGDVRLLAWRTARETLYEGVGLLFGRRLVAAWATPRASIEVIRYRPATDVSAAPPEDVLGGPLAGRWAARERAAAGPGEETFMPLA
ncbi:MAG: hypothetical protein ACFE0R_06800 [Salinarimonas sp.]